MGRIRDEVFDRMWWSDTPLKEFSYVTPSRQYGKSRMAFEYAKRMVENTDLPRMKYYLTQIQYEKFLAELGQDFVDKHCIVENR